MSQSEVTREGLKGTRPGREALTGVHAGRRRGLRRRGEQPVVPPATSTSYYGKPVINSPVWSSPDIPGYLFLGGLAGASSLLGAGAQLTSRGALAKTAKTSALAAAGLSLAGLVHDLGRPARFVNMLRMFKVTSPMSVGSWILSGYVPAAWAAGLAALTGRVPRIGVATTAGAAVLGPALASYTAALISDTAVPAWHDGYREMPFVFVGSAATAAGGVGLLGAPVSQSAPALYLALFGTCTELAAFQRMTRRIGMVAEPYHSGRAGAYVKASEALSALGLAGALLGRHSRLASAVSGAALVATSAATRWGIFHAGFTSADDPRYTVVPQRERLTNRAQADGPPGVRSDRGLPLRPKVRAHPPSVSLWAAGPARGGRCWRVPVSCLGNPRRTSQMGGGGVVSCRSRPITPRRARSGLAWDCKSWGLRSTKNAWPTSATGTGSAKLEVFGSQAPGTARPDIDIDVLYTLRPGRKLGWEIEQFADELSDLFGREVDLISLRSLHPLLQRSVLAEARLLYAA